MLATSLNVSGLVAIANMESERPFRRRPFALGAQNVYLFINVFVTRIDAFAKIAAVTVMPQLKHTQPVLKWRFDSNVINCKMYNLSI
jgi:hypothetical protein